MYTWLTCAVVFNLVLEQSGWLFSTEDNRMLTKIIRIEENC